MTFRHFICHSKGSLKSGCWSWFTFNTRRISIQTVLFSKASLIFLCLCILLSAGASVHVSVFTLFCLWQRSFCRVSSQSRDWTEALHPPPSHCFSCFLPDEELRRPCLPLLPPPPPPLCPVSGQLFTCVCRRECVLVSLCCNVQVLISETGTVRTRVNPVAVSAVSCFWRGWWTEHVRQTWNKQGLSHSDKTPDDTWHFHVKHSL